MSSNKDAAYVQVDNYSSGGVRYAEVKHVPMETYFEGTAPGLIQVNGKDFDSKSFRFPEWQGTSKLEFESLQPADVSRMHHPSHGSLSEIYATAICGNDLCSSVLYVIGITMGVSGQLAPVCLLLVGGLLYLFTSIYGEACTAFPLNGGTYNLLLNTTTKTIAALAACLTLLSYTATAVVSAAESVTYAYNLYPFINVYWFTIFLLASVCGLAILGIAESALVALAIFILHMGSMVALVIVGALYSINNPGIFWANLALPLKYSWPVSLVAGFCAAILGVTGFESSANFIEEQRKGVYPKTLFNAWVIVFVLNPLLSLVVLGVVDLRTLDDSTGDVLAVAARIAGGELFGLWVSAEGAVVLAGAVLTAFVGVTGLVRRLASDRCLPSWLLAENALRRTNHWIPLVFFAFCGSLYVILGGRVVSLANMYTLAFLCVMALFAYGTMMLKYKRGRIRRDVEAAWPSCVLGLAGVVLALLGNLWMQPASLFYLAIYFGLVAGVMMLMFERVRLLKYLLFFVSRAPEGVRDALAPSTMAGIEVIKSQKIVFFAKNGNLEVLNKALAYIHLNELTEWIKVVHVFTDLEGPAVQSIAESLAIIDRCYPKMLLDLVLVEGEFCPELVMQVSDALQVPRNFMFITAPGPTSPTTSASSAASESSPTDPARPSHHPLTLCPSHHPLT
eukprot:CAMPEP_0172189052 /NCGR_PEP_ID=MMETSP1050-20130122/22299_1 /TAXON_ID=233186 /ORGANISM="Cryptomonas curvata, Strain CCAP979/52" /LENGTH=676 /DNA_ID=CAMNT_0012863683 /DNA_START=76 /DNA_END=2104 /DNA_ORIENTATION=+